MTTTTAVPSSYHHLSLDEAVMARHSSRRFLSTPVSPSILRSALNLALHAPSNSNIQPWRLFVLTGAALDRLKAALMAAASSGAEPQVPPLPAEFAPFRSELGKDVYGRGLGLPRGDPEARRQAVLRNYDFFGAPVAIVVGMSRDLAGCDAMSVGMYLQTFLLGLAEAGVQSCVEVSVTGYADVIREVAGVPDELDIFCGVAVGYEDDEKVNKLRASRLAVESTTVFLDA